MYSIKKFFSFTVFLFAFIAALSLTEPRVQAATASSKAGKIATQETNLNVRKSANVSSSVVKSLKKGSWITLISKKSGFWKVEYASGKYGYCHPDYIKKSESSNAMFVQTSGGKLNVRKGKGTSYDVKAKLSNGKCVVVLSKSDSWYKILYNGNKTGYVNKKYLSKTKPQAVNLDVTSFKQTDSRWKNIKIGVEGDTIGSSGCTTTCLAMTESFRTKTTINPGKMAEKLSYTQSGALYWPQNYKTQLVTSENYLSLIYNQLSNGKPVILGAKKSNSSQHWVVVKSFSGSSLKAENFGINDPGSSKRTTLADFIAVYPILYKAAWY